MDYIFRWIQIRFLSGHQLDLFAGLSPQQPAIPVDRHRHQPRLRRHPERSAQRAVEGPRGCHPAAKPQACSHRFTFGDADHHLHHPTPARNSPRPRRQQRPRPTTRSSYLRSRRPRPLPRRRRHEVHVRHGRRPLLRHLRSHHDPQRLLLPLHVLRKHQRLQLRNQMKCPHCNVTVHLQLRSAIVIDARDASGKEVRWSTQSEVCPSCGQAVIYLGEVPIAYFPDGRKTESGTAPTIYLAWPKSGTRPCPPHVPHDLKKDFDEAVNVLRIVPRLCGINETFASRVLRDYGKQRKKIYSTESKKSSMPTSSSCIV